MSRRVPWLAASRASRKRRANAGAVDEADLGEVEHDDGGVSTHRLHVLLPTRDRGKIELALHLDNRGRLLHGHCDRDSQRAVVRKPTFAARSNSG